MSSTRTVSEDVANILKRWITPIKNGKRKISTATLSPPQRRRHFTPFRSSSSSTISADDFSASYTFEEWNEVEIPAILDSLETLEFIGFSSNVAKTIWEGYERSSRLFPDLDAGMLDVAMSHLEAVEVENCTSEGQDWEGAMVKMGINAKLRRAILLPEFSDIRYTADMKFWVQQAVQEAFTSLEYLDQRLREESPRLLQLSERQKARIAVTPSSDSPLSRKESLKKSSKPSITAGSSKVPVVSFSTTSDSTSPTP
jgi:hypothetical protein